MISLETTKLTPIPLVCRLIFLMCRNLDAYEIDIPPFKQYFSSAAVKRAVESSYLLWFQDICQSCMFLVIGSPN